MSETETRTEAATAAYHRHDISDRTWETIAPHLPGAPWRDLPPDYGHWNTTHRRFTRWQEDGHWARLLAKCPMTPIWNG